MKPSKQKKVSLDVDNLKVETFDTLDPKGLIIQGTVGAYAQTDVPCCTWSCGGTCGAYPDTTWLKAATQLDAAAFRTFNKCCV